MKQPEVIKAMMGNSPHDGIQFYTKSQEDKNECWQWYIENEGEETMGRCLDKICEVSNIWIDSERHLYLNSGDWSLKETTLTWTELKEKFGIIIGEEKKVEKFKVGDRVEIINGNEILIGKTGTVIGIIEKQAVIELDDKNAWKNNPCMLFNNIKKIECESQAEPFELKVGDKFVTAMEEGMFDYCKGQILTVKNILDDNGIPYYEVEEKFGDKSYGLWFEGINWEATRKLNETKEEPKQEQYLVWSLKGTSPKKIHNSLEEAKKEAERLAKLNIGQEFNVVKIVGKVKTEASVKWEGEK